MLYNSEVNVSLNQFVCWRK